LKLSKEGEGEKVSEKGGNPRRGARGGKSEGRPGVRER